jgi:hypothetical protein
MRRVIDLFSEQGTVDEMGLGTIRDTLSDTLFPGTSVIQTRLRYFLFIPWLYQRLESRRTSSSEITAAIRKAELDLVGALLNSEDTDGIIGSQARNTLTRIPSEIYWAGLVRWGIFQHPQSRGWYHANFDGMRKGQEHFNPSDDPGVIWTRQSAWHPRIPPPPEGFPWEASLDLTADEAEFLRGRIEERCSGSLLAWLAQEGSSELAEHFWEEPVALRASGALDTAIELARRFSLHVEGLPLLYNLLLAERRHADQGDDADLIEKYRTALLEWADRENAESPFETTLLWRFLVENGGRLIEPQRRFVETWAKLVTESGAPSLIDSVAARHLVEQRELQLKGKRARLSNRERLLDWTGDVGTGRMNFRWPRVRQLLVDLHYGLEA